MEKRENAALREVLVQGLKSCADRIVEQNRTLLVRVKMRGFNPCRELDFTDNGAGVYLRKFFEAVAKFEEGKVPCEELKEFFATTNSLVDELKKLKNAPVCELDDAGVAFRQAATFWMDNHDEPLMERKTYLKKHFACEREICGKLKVLHAAYVRIYAAKGRKKATFSAASQMEDDSGKAKERRVIFAEIDRLVNLGNSIPKAIAIMKSGSYEARMRGVKAETWKRYYTKHTREKELRKRRDEPLNGVGEPIKVPGEPLTDEGEPINEPLNGESEPLKVLGEPLKNRSEPIKLGISEKLLQEIGRNPGINRVRLMNCMGLSRSTISRSLVRLVEAGEIVYRGSKKTGGYYLAQSTKGSDR